MSGLMTIIPLPLIAALLFAIFWAASIFGAVLRQRRMVSSDLVYATSAAVSLLVLLIGFTFSLALNRYDSRRALVVEEASAIHAVWTRLPLMPQPERAQMEKLTRAYAAQREAYFTYGIDLDKQMRADVAADAIVDTMWDKVRSLPDTTMAPVMTRMLMDNLGRIDDVAWRREDMARAHIPFLVINLLIVFSILTAISMGISGAPDRRVHPTHLIFFALNAAAIMLVFDLDRPRLGLVLVSQRPIAEVQEMMASDAARYAAREAAAAPVTSPR